MLSTSATTNGFTPLIQTNKQTMLLTTLAHPCHVGTGTGLATANQPRSLMTGRPRIHRAPSLALAWEMKRACPSAARSTGSELGSLPGWQAWTGTPTSKSDRKPARPVLLVSCFRAGHKNGAHVPKLVATHSNHSDHPNLAELATEPRR